MMMMMMKASEVVGYVTAMIGLVTVVQTMVQALLPAALRGALAEWAGRLAGRLWQPYHVYVEVPEYDDGDIQCHVSSSSAPSSSAGATMLCCNELYAAVRLHLSAHVAAAGGGADPAPPSGPSCAWSPRLKLFASRDGAYTWSPASGQPVAVTFQGARLWWEHHISPGAPGRGGHAAPGYWPRAGSDADERRFYMLKLQRSDQARVLVPYVRHILSQARDIRHRSRERFLYTNGSRHDSLYRHPWESVPFRHPSTFDTLALDPSRKALIRSDLEAFAKGEAFYKRTGRAWKRGYLLHGPPGTGKSSLIAAMANLLRYDVYDLELTQVRSNAELRKLLLRTTNKSIIVIEDIDCSLDLGSKRLRKAEPYKGAHDYIGSEYGGSGSKPQDESAPMSSAVTLSGLLNFTDGLWSCCGDERIFVFTTNHIESLDPALLRSGRMDMHIFMSYCTFEAFKILASNYLGIEEHILFHKVEEMIDDAHVTPAEVSEILVRHRESPDRALQELIAALEVAKAKPWPQSPWKEKDASSSIKSGLDCDDQDVEQVKRAVLLDGNSLEEIPSNRIESLRCRKADTEVVTEAMEKHKLDIHDDDAVCVEKDHHVPQKLEVQKKLD